MNNRFNYLSILIKISKGVILIQSWVCSFQSVGTIFLLLFLYFLSDVSKAGEVGIFDNEGGGWKGEHYALSLISYFSYHQEETGACNVIGGSALCHLGFKKVKSIIDSQHRDTQAYISTSKSGIFISFRGSESSSLEKIRKDWLETDLRINVLEIASTEGPIQFHNGFWTAVDDVIDELVDYLKKQKKPPGKDIYVTGHSLGGALAQIAAFRLFQLGFDIHSVVTFASPKTANYRLKYWYQKKGIKLYEWGNNNDPFPQLPVTGKNLMNDRMSLYKHAGTLIIVKTNGKISLGGRFNYIPDITFGAHSMAGYVNAAYHNMPASLKNKWQLPIPVRDELKADHKSCSTSSSCRGYRCRSLRCYSPNSKSISHKCLFDNECKTGRCSNAGGALAVGGKLTAGRCVCLVDSDCRSSLDYFCNVGMDLGFIDPGKNKCVQKISSGEACFNDTQCKSGKCSDWRPQDGQASGICFNPDSVDIGGGCKIDQECKRGKCNSNKVCVCKNNSDCGSGYWCKNGLDLTQNKCYRKKSNGSSCSHRSQCKSGECGAFWPFKGKCH